MALGQSRGTLTAKILGVDGDPPVLHWRAVGGEGKERRPLSGVVPIDDPAVLAAALAIEGGAFAELTIVTELGQPGMPKRLEAIRAVAQKPLAAAA